MDEFQAKYTSEDNSSFTQILEDENAKRKEKYGWAWNAQKRVEAQRDRMVEMRERMLIEPAPATGVREKFTIEAPKPAGLIAEGDDETTKELEPQAEDENTSDGKGKDVVLRDKHEEAEVVDVMAPKKDKRTTVVEGWKFKVHAIFH